MPVAIPTPPILRAIPPVRYRRMPSALMPEPIIPERVMLPQAGVHSVFELRVASDDATASDAYAVRWQVYCHELGYEPADRFPDGREWDAADARSVQVVAYHRTSGRPAGCFRLLLADPVECAAPFHLEEVCTRLVSGALPSEGERRLGCAEISRFCILGAFRRFDAATEAPPWGIDARVWAAEAIHRRGLAGLMWLAAARLAVSLRLDYLLALMEPRLQLLSRTLGFSFEEIGQPVEFRGTRMPYRIDRRAMRALLAVPSTAALLAPMTAALEDQARRHPLLGTYFEARSEMISRG